MDIPETLAESGAATDSLDEYDLEESSSIDDGTLPADRFLDRELSWLAFNQRVLELAEDKKLPLLERTNFLAIFASNLDEFFMVRVAGLKRRIVTGLAVPTNIGTPPAEVLALVAAKTHELQERHAKLFSEVLKPALDDASIHIETWADLGDADRERIDEIFSSQIFPVLMPLAVDPAHPFPYISGLSLNLSIRVRNPKTEKEEFARLKVPSNLPRFIQLPDDSSGRLRYIPLEDLISNHLGDLFPGMEIIAHHEFRVTRNEDVEVDEDESENLIKALEKQILSRRFGPPIRLEITDDMDPVTLSLLVRELAVTEQEVYRLPAPLDLGGLFQLTRLDRPALKYPRHVPTTSVNLLPFEPNAAPDIFASIARQ
ncbi:MAG: RNA degradosome polyphosphate kinase, partial [Rhodoglobus sp.]|nr:RNA degradosome polyphosphate kinase [Rhodoglobus sp.]